MAIDRTFDLGDKTFTFSEYMSDDNFYQLATRILIALGCSYEIVRPDEFDSRWGGRNHILKQRDVDAETYLQESLPSNFRQMTTADRELYAASIRQAFRAGWAKAPKPLLFPFR